MTPEQMSRAHAGPVRDAHPMTARQRDTLIQELKCHALYVGWAISNLQSGCPIESCTESEDVRILLRSLHEQIVR